MPSKYYNGQNPLGRRRIKQNDGGLARVEQEVGRLQPALSLHIASKQLPNGRVLFPQKRARAGSVVGCIPWKPRIVDERAEGATSPDYQLYLNPGTVNGVLNANWNDSVGNIPEPVEGADPVLKYIVLELTFTQGELNGIAYSLDASIPAANDLDPVGRNVLPDSLKIVIGTMADLQPCMIYDKNLIVSSVDVFHERLTSIPYGEQPYYVWYKYQVSTT